MIRIFDDEKLPDSIEVYSNYEEEQIAYEDGYIAGQNSLVSVSKPIEWLDEMAEKWLYSAQRLSNPNAYEVKPFPQFIQENWQ